MEPITLFAIYTSGIIIGTVGIGFYINERSKDYYQNLKHFIEDNFVLRF